MQSAVDCITLTKFVLIIANMSASKVWRTAVDRISEPSENFACVSAADTDDKIGNSLYDIVVWMSYLWTGKENLFHWQI